MPHGGTQGLSKVPCLTEEEERFPLSKPVVGQNIALHAVPAYRTSTYLVSAFAAHSISCSPNVSTPYR